MKHTFTLSKILLLLLILQMHGCAVVQEPPAAADATPPAGYAPIYVKKNVVMPAVAKKDMTVHVSRADVRDPGRVKLYANIIDSSGNNYTGAALKAWCMVVDSSDKGQATVKNALVREVTESDKISTGVVFVVDNSGSMGEERANAVQIALQDLFKAKQVSDGIAVVRYDNKVGVEVPLSTNASTLQSSLKMNGLQGYGGLTAIHNGIAAAIEHLRSNGTKFERTAIVAFTDGNENSSTLNKDSLIGLALASGTAVHCVDFGSGVKDGYMQEISNKTGGSYHHMYLTSEFANVFEDIYRRIKNHYVIEINTRTYGDQRKTL